MKRSAGAALLALFALAASAEADPLAIEGHCKVRVFGTSTMHDFEGEAPCATLAIEPAGDGAYRARVEVAVDALDTGISARNTRMRKMFEAKRYPKIVGVFEHIDPAALRKGASGALAFRLALHGVERRVAPRTANWSEVPAKSAHFQASFDVSLRDFKLEAPVVMGFVRVGDGVRVEVDVELAARAR